MIIVYPNLATEIMVVDGVENAEFPMDNTLNGHPTLPGRMEGLTGEIKMVVGGGANCLFVYACNLNEMTVACDGWTSTFFFRDVVDTLTKLLTGRDDDGNILYNRTSAFIDYPDQPYLHELTISFQANEPVSIGVLVAGTRNEFPQIRYDLNESVRDYSVIQSLASGAENIIPGNIVKTYSVAMKMDRVGDFYPFMRQIIKENGQAPLAIKLTDNEDEMEVFGKITSPYGTHGIRTQLKFDIEEIV